MMLTVNNNTVVFMDYTLRLDDDEIADSSEGRGPLEFIPGQGQIISGLEKAMLGMQLGEEKRVVVEPAEGYGEFNADLFEELDRTVFPPDLDLEVGMGFRMRAASGQAVVAYVHELTDDSVLMNLNHPLAGKTLYFDVKVSDIREATDDDLAGCSCGSCGSCGGSCGDDDCGCGDDDSCGCGDGCGH